MKTAFSLRDFSQFLLTALCTGLVACAHSARNDQERSPASQKSISQSGPEPTYATLKQLLVSEQPRTIAEVLERLAQKYPAYMAAHTLAYNSLSLHETSFENPRAIVFGNSAKLVLTFNGQPSQRNYSNLEIMSFDPERGFEFREIHFPGEGGGESTISESEIELKTSTVHISKPNPEMCMQCHGQGGQSFAKPIWQPYFSWPGMYGSNDDNLFRILAKNPAYPRTQSLELGIGFRGKDRERAGYEAYSANRKTNSRYRHLPSSPRVVPRPAALFFGDSPANDFKNRPNLALLASIDDQIGELLFRDFVAKNPVDDLWLAVNEALCGSKTQDFVPSFLLKIDPDLKQTADTTQALKSGTTYIREDDFGRIYDFFGGEVVAGGPATLTAPKMSRDVFIEKVMPGLGVEKSVAQISVILKSIGLDLGEYAYSLRREPNFSNGIDALWGFSERVKAEVKRRGLPKSKICRERERQDAR